MFKNILQGKKIKIPRGNRIHDSEIRSEASNLLRYAVR